MYLLTILGIAKVLGSLAIIQTKFKAIKEWAYAGFTIDYLSTAASFYFVGGGAFSIIFPLIFLAVLFVSYYFWKRTE